MDLDYDFPIMDSRDPRLRSTTTTENCSNWQTDTVPAAKKRTHEFSNDSTAKRPAVLNKNNNILTLSNRFSPLSECVDSGNEDRPNIIREPKPEPIFVTGVNSIKELKDILFGLIPDYNTEKFSITTMKSGHTVKISPTDVPTYKLIREKFLACNINHYTYRLKHERAYRVVMRGVHHTEDKELMKNELEARGHKVRSITNVMHRATKEPLALFFIDLEPNTNNKDIFSITHLLHCIVKFEAPYKKREVVQCKRCQRFGHTKNFCNRPYRCVKCSGDHSTECCKKSSNTAAVCINCGDSHPASYKGCKMYQQYKSKIFQPIRRERQQVQNEIQHEARPVDNNQYRTSGISYAQKVRNSPDRAQTQPINENLNNPNPDSGTLLSVMEQMFTRFENIVERMMDRVLDMFMTKFSNK
jgi:hypothetical protein